MSAGGFEPRSHNVSRSATAAQLGQEKNKVEWGIEKDLLKSRIYFPFVVPSQKLGDINDHPHVIIFLRGGFLPSFFLLFRRRLLNNRRLRIFFHSQHIRSQWKMPAQTFRKRTYEVFSRATVFQQV